MQRRSSRCVALTVTAAAGVIAAAVTLAVRRVQRHCLKHRYASELDTSTVPIHNWPVENFACGKPLPRPQKAGCDEQKGATLSHCKGFQPPSAKAAVGCCSQLLSYRHT